MKYRYPRLTKRSISNFPARILLRIHCCIAWLVDEQLKTAGGSFFASALVKQLGGTAAETHHEQARFALRWQLDSVSDQAEIVTYESDIQATYQS